MDTHPGIPPTTITVPPVPAAPEQGLVATWPRSVQLALGVLLVGCVIILAGRSMFQTLQAGPSTIPAQRIDLNSATHAELLLLPGVGVNLAERIAQVRAKNLFQKVDDLRKVPGIGPATLERLRAWVFVSAKPPDAAMEPSLPLTVEPSQRPGAKPRKGTTLDGPIDINSAGTAQLMQIPGIGPKLSQRIVDERAQKPFQTVADLRRVHGIGPKILEKMRPFITVAPRTPVQ
jgi:competence protein ComEA